MSEQQHCLGVAWLTERPPATAYREETERPLQGYFMLSGGDEGLRVTVQLDNCRRLSPQEPGNAHIYEAVLLTEAGDPTDAGGFNAMSAGSSSATFLLPDQPPTETVQARVDLLTVAGARETLLEGPVIWLQAPIDSEQGARPAVADGAFEASLTPADEPEPSEPAVEATRSSAVPDATVVLLGGALPDDQATPDPQEVAADDGAPDPQEVAADGGAPDFQAPPVAERAPTAYYQPSPFPTAPFVAPLPNAGHPVGAPPYLGTAPAGPPGAQPFPGSPYWQPPRMPDPAMGVPPLFAAPYHWSYAAKPMGPAHLFDPTHPYYPPPFESEARVSAVPTPPTVEPEVPIAAPPEPAAAPVPPTEPVTESAPQPTRLMLERLHHSAFGATGYGLIDTAGGGVEVTVRGLPNPALLGGNLTLYKVWLVSERGRAYLPVGNCTKLFADTYRAAATSLPLHRYESLLVTAEENPNYGFPVGVKVMGARLLAQV